jgi:hypothetical protein
VDYQLLLQKQIFSDNRTAAAGSDQFGDGGEQVKKQEKDISHAARG